MGDMKTPDFDDLLAAFDIPDATSLDGKEGIHGNQDVADGHLKHQEMCMETALSIPHLVPAIDAPVVSVIVKNTSCQNSNENLVEKDSAHLGHHLHNGCKAFSTSLETLSSCYVKLDSSSVNGSGLKYFLEKYEKKSGLSASVAGFSPISSTESEDIPKDGRDDCLKTCDTSNFLSDSLFTSSTVPVSDNNEKPNFPNLISTVRQFGSNEKDDRGCNGSPFKFDEMKNNDLNAEKKCNQSYEAGSQSPESSAPCSPSCIKSQTSRLSSCLNALAALNAKTDSDGQIDSKDIPVTSKDYMKMNQKLPLSSPRSPLEIAKRYGKQPDSPISVCSDNSGKMSPAAATGSSLAIPRVRIKTIKTSSGEIKRTITSILPDCETEDVMPPFGSSPSQSTVEQTFSKPLLLSLSNDLTSQAVLEDGSREISNKLSTSSKAEKISEKLKSQNDSFKTTQDVKTKSSFTQLASANANYLPKALHLANLNLVPHSVAASVTARSSSNRQKPSRLSSSMVCSSVPLVHQVKKASPNARVAVQNAAAGTLNRLLNYTNPVPTYVPNLCPPPGTNIKLPQHGYCCLECGDSFGLEKSLAFHYSRRSVHIEVVCTHCSKTLVFYNRCALLAHARDHKKKGMVMQCTQLLMKPIAVDQMVAPTDPKKSLRQLAFWNWDESSNGQGVLPLYPEKVIRKGFKCLDCNTQMVDSKALAGHYQKPLEPEGLICKVCSMRLPNKCSYSAHQRIHTHKSPYCCPECGALCHSVDIQKHVKENCLHYARKIGFSCLHCEMLFISLAQLRSHIEDKHCEVYYKCTVCPVAFKSSDGCFMHVKYKHDISDPRHQVIYKCSCQTVFKKKQLFYQHFDNQTCVFKCPGCTSLFREKFPLVHHFKTTHDCVFRDEAEKSSKKMKVSENPQSNVTKPVDEDSMKETDHSAAKISEKFSFKNAGWTCEVCHLWLPDRDAYVNHMNTHHGKFLKSQTCRLCEKSFKSSLSLKQHIHNVHKEKRKMYTCWYCRNERLSFTEQSLLENHVRLMHGIKNPDFSQMFQLKPQEWGKLSDKRPKKRGAQETEQVVINRGTRHSKRAKANYLCAKCGFACEEQVQFQEHIPQHRTDSNTPQCQNCGLCFTSQLALRRHLFIVHKIREAERVQAVQDEDTERELATSTNLRDETVPPLLKESDSSRSQEQILHNEPTDNACKTGI